MQCIGQEGWVDGELFARLDKELGFSIDIEILAERVASFEVVSFGDQRCKPAGGR